MTGGRWTRQTSSRWAPACTSSPGTRDSLTVRLPPTRGIRCTICNAHVPPRRLLCGHATSRNLVSLTVLVSPGGDSYQAIRDGKLSLLPTFSTSFRALLAQMLAPKPADRPAAEQIQAHPLLNPRRASPPQGSTAQPRWSRLRHTED